MADVATVPAPTPTLAPPLSRGRLEIHPCNARPDLYPAGGPPLGAGLIHDNAAGHLEFFLSAHLEAIGCEQPVVVQDVLLHADRGEAANPDLLRYTRPDVLVYKALRAGRDPANAFHLDYDGPPDLVVEILSASTWKKDVGVGRNIADKMRHYQSVGVSEYWVYNPELLQRKQGLPFFQGYALQGDRYRPISRWGNCWPSAVLGALWERGDRHRPVAGAEYTLMRLRKPGSTRWYPTSAERDTELKTTKSALAERDTELKTTKSALAERDTELKTTKSALERAKAEAAERNELLAYYQRKFGPLDPGEAKL